MNYLEFFGLQSEPFLNSPSSRVFYKSAAHGKALLRLMTAADADEGSLLLVGAPGLGKSLLLRRVLETVSDEGTRTAYLPVPVGGLSEADLARLLAVQLRGASAASLAKLGKHIASLKDRGQNVLMLIDDAERLAPELLEGIVALAGASVVLTGGTGLSLAGAERYELPPLNQEATEAYIRLRLKTSGRVQEIFTAPARAQVFEASRGIPYQINSLCELALISAALAGLERVDETIVEAAMALASRSPSAAPGQPSAMSAPAAVAAAAVASAAIVASVSDGDTAFAEEDESASEPAAAAPAGDSDEDSTLDDLLGELEKDDEPEQSGTGDELDDMLGGLTDREPVAPALRSQSENDLGGLLDELEHEEANEAVTVAAPAVEDDGGLDDILGGLEAEEQEAAVGDNGQSVDDLLGDLGNDDDSDSFAEEDPLGSMLDELEADAASSQPSPAKQEVDDDLDSLLGDLETEPQPKAPPTAVADNDDGLDDLLNDLGADEAPMHASSGADDDLDSLLGELGGEDEPVQAAASPGDDLDDLLNGLDDEPAGDVDAGGGDELDDLLSGLTVDEPMPVAPAIKTPASGIKTKAQPAASAPAEESDLDDLLSSLENDLGPAAAEDSLEDELDSLLEGLDD